MSEMDWRHYDPFLGRFNAVDKLAENTFGLSNYVFANDNPILFSDPSGLAGIQTNYGVDSFGRNRFDDYGTFITPDDRGAVSFDMASYMGGGNGYRGPRLGGIGPGAYNSIGSYGDVYYRDSITGNIYAYMISGIPIPSDIPGAYKNSGLLLTREKIMIGNETSISVVTPTS